MMTTMSEACAKKRKPACRRPRVGVGGMRPGPRRAGRQETRPDGNTTEYVKYTPAFSGCSHENSPTLPAVTSCRAPIISKSALSTHRRESNDFQGRKREVQRSLRVLYQPLQCRTSDRTQRIVTISSMSTHWFSNPAGINLPNLL